MLLKTFGAILVTATVADASELTWALEPAAGVSGTITFDTNSPNFAAGRTAELGEGIVDYEFSVNELEIAWTTEDVAVFGLADVMFGGTTSPDAAMASFWLLDTDRLSPTTNTLEIRPIGHGLHDIRYGPSDNPTVDGPFRFRVIPEPTTFALVLVAAAAGRRRR